MERKTRASEKKPNITDDAFTGRKDDKKSDGHDDHYDNSQTTTSKETVKDKGTAKEKARQRVRRGHFMSNPKRPRGQHSDNRGAAKRARERRRTKTRVTEKERG